MRMEMGMEMEMGMKTGMETAGKNDAIRTADALIRSLDCAEQETRALLRALRSHPARKMKRKPSKRGANARRGTCERASPESPE